MRQQLVEQLICHEGLRLFPYMDTVGKITIGVGRNLSDVGITHDEALAMLEYDVDSVLVDLASFAWFSALDPVRQRVMADMRFNLGPTRFRGFKRMLTAMAACDYRTAADSMQKSLWSQQVGTRAKRLIAMMRTGVDL